MEDNQQIQDPSTEGVGGLKGLRGINTIQEESIQDTPRIKSLDDFRRHYSKSLQRAVPQKVGFVGVGDSTYDEDITSITQLDNLQNTRGELQPWYAQIGAGLAKGAVLAGTTFADGIIGTIVGIGNAAATGTFSGFWDNPFSNAMQQVNEWSERVLPNYYTDAELNDPWYTNIFTANFIGDKFLKNLGFAVGAAYSGKIYSGLTSKLLGLNKARQAFKGAVTASGEMLNPRQALQAYKQGDLFLDGVQLTEDLAKAAKKLRMAEPTLKLTGAFSGALGEARIEAINNSKDWFDLHKQQLDDAYEAIMQEERESLLKEFPNLAVYQITPDGTSFEQILTPGGEAMLKQRASQRMDYEGGLKKLSEDRAKLGNIDFILNLPLLTISDAWQFGKFYAGGYNTAKKAGNIIKNVAQDGTVSYMAQKPSFMRGAVKVLNKGIAEGPYEEMGQSVAGKLAGYKYASELNDFYGAKIDPEAEEETIDWLKATAKAITETYGTAEGWEEGFIGGFTGMVGIPGFRSVRNKEGGLQSPIYLQGGIREDIKEIRDQREQADAIVTQLNNRVQSPEFLNYYQSAIRHNKYQRDMDEAAQNNDNFEFKNAEHNQLINDVIMFDKAGRIQDLYDIIDEAGNVSEADVEQIKQLTTNKETGKSVYDGMTDQEIIDQIQKQTEETRQAVDNYRRISQDLQVRIGDYFEEDGLEEMTYYMSNIDNLENRFKSIQDNLKSRLQGVLDASMDVEFRSDSQQDRIFRLSDLINMPAVRLINTIADSKDVQSYIRDIDKSLQDIPDKQDIIDQINDLGRIAERRIDFIDKYDLYLKNPGLLQMKQEEQREDVVEEKERQEIAKTKDAALAATNLNEFREALNNETDINKRQEILQELEKEGNQLAKDYKEVHSYTNEVSKAIQDSDFSQATKDRAFELLNDQLVHSNNLQEVANPNSEYITNPASLFDINLDEQTNALNFAEAQLVLLGAMERANNSQLFKERFPSEYLTPVSNMKGAKYTTKDATGDSSTSTIPTSIPATIDIPEPPVGDITTEMVKEENDKANIAVETPQTIESGKKGKRQYYRPTIPELHIEASKEGDFRPFNIVVAERENLNFDELYNYLRDSGAFSYVNEGNLKVGDELGFMIDPKFNDHTIFIVDRRNNQVVGSLDESQYVVDRYEGLAGLIDRIKEEFNQTGKDNQFIATPTTRVSQLMVGRIPYGQEERQLQDIPGVSKESIFGIIKNGTLSTNGKIPDNKIIKPVDMSGKEGRMYILIPNAAGKYSPAAVRVKHFNSTEYNPEDVTVNSTPVYKRIAEGIEHLADSIYEEDVKQAVSELSRSLYMRDVHIDYVAGKYGTSIRLSKVERDTNGNEVYTITEDGRRVRKENTKIVYLTEKWDPNTEYIIGSQGVVTSPEKRDSQQIQQEVLNILQEFNLPIQISVNRLNNAGYNQMLLSSGVLTSNITEASVRSSWFTTDYFDIKGNLQYALNPASAIPTYNRDVTPVGGTNSAIAGTPITQEGVTYYVDLATNTVRDSNNRTLSTYPENIKDLTYIQDNFGNAQNSSIMINGLALLPNGKVINRNTGEYITGKKASQLINSLSQRNISRADSKKVIDYIAENQKKVNKEATDSNYYYILEEDGQYHQYDRVHKRLGDNWVESEKQSSAIRDIRTNLSKYTDNITQFNNYLQSLQSHYGLDLTNFIGKTDVRSRDSIANTIRDKMSGSNTQISLQAGTSVDSVIRNFFTSSEMPIRPSNITEEAFNNLIYSLNEIKSNIEARGETFITNNVVLFQKYNDGTRVAGEVDILSVDSDGNFKIYDVKTSKYSFYDFVDKYGRKANYFQNKSKTQKMSSKDYYTKQLSAYKNLFESQYDTPVTTLAILPFVLGYSGSTVNQVTKEKGIIISYDPTVNVPISGNVNTPIISNTNDSLPIFNSTFESMDPVNNVLPDYTIENGKVGYFIRDGKLHSGYLSPIGQINGIDIYMTKVPNITRGFGNQPAHPASNNFYAVFPNGNSVEIVKNANINSPEKSIGEKIMKALKGNPSRLSQMAQEETILTQSISLPQITEAINKPQDQPISTRGALSTIQAELDIIPQDDEFEPDFKLREVADLSEPVWDKDKELEWLNRVLPQLSQNQRVLVQEGLIEVAKSGTLAWGKFSDGIITLSNIAAEGTTYHEAFHVVFNLLTNSTKRQELFEEAKAKFGDLNDSELEERMAEDFREYVMTRDNKNITNRILDFFKQLLAKITNWGRLRPALIEYYRNINEGYYSTEHIVLESSKSTQNLSFDNVQQEVREDLENKGWTKERWDSISQAEREQALRCL